MALRHIEIVVLVEGDIQRLATMPFHLLSSQGVLTADTEGADAIGIEEDRSGKLLTQILP